MTCCQYEPLLAFLLDDDPRPGDWCHYPWAALVKLILAALVSGCAGPTAMARWAGAHRFELAPVLGLPDARCPSEPTFRRTLAAISPVTTEAAIAAHNAQPACDGGQGATWVGRDGLTRRLLSLDGKVLCTASAHGQRVWLVSLADPLTGVVLAQARVRCGTNEIPTAAALLAGWDLTGIVVAVDAGLAQRDLAEQIVAQGGDFLMVIKGNQETTEENIALLFATPSSPCFDPDRERCTRPDPPAHGRIEERTLEASDLLDEVTDWPGAKQVARRLNRVTERRTQRPRKERYTYLVTSLGPDVAGAGHLLTLARMRWGIENRVHWVRDVTLGEDDCRVWREGRPQVLAAWRNGLLAAVRAWGDFASLPEALAWAAADPSHALQLIGAL